MECRHGYGLAFLAFCDQRAAACIQRSPRVQRDLQDMARLPSPYSAYHQPAQGPGHFTFIGGGLEERLGVTPDELTQDPIPPWRMAQLLHHAPPPTQGVEFSVQHHQPPRLAELPQPG